MVVHPNKETEPCNINVVMLCSSCGLAVMSSCGYLSHSSSSQTSIGALIFPRRISRQNSFRFNVLILFPHLHFFCRGNNVISPDFTRFFRILRLLSALSQTVKLRFLPFFCRGADGRDGFYPRAPPFRPPRKKDPKRAMRRDARGVAKCII